MKSVTEKGLEILLRQGYGGQERGGVRGGEKAPRLLKPYLPTCIGNSAFKFCSDLKYQQVCSGSGAGDFGNGGKVRLCQSFKLQLAVGAKVNENGLPGENFAEL